MVPLTEQEFQQLLEVSLGTNVSNTMPAEGECGDDDSEMIDRELQRLQEEIDWHTKEAEKCRQALAAEAQEGQDLHALSGTNLSLPSREKEPSVSGDVQPEASVSNGDQPTQAPKKGRKQGLQVCQYCQQSIDRNQMKEHSLRCRFERVQQPEGTQGCKYCGQFKTPKEFPDHFKRCQEEDKFQSRCPCGKYKVPRGVTDEDVQRHIQKCPAMRMAEERGSIRYVVCPTCLLPWFYSNWYKMRHRRNCAKKRAAAAKEAQAADTGVARESQGPSVVATASDPLAPDTILSGDAKEPNGDAKEQIASPAGEAPGSSVRSQKRHTPPTPPAVPRKKTRRGGRRRKTSTEFCGNS